jgi:hypothetical protein
MVMRVPADSGKQTGTVFACNLEAIGAAARPRYSELVKQIRAALYERSEIREGYRFRLDGKAVTLAEAAEWIEMERLCCPFLTFQLTASGGSSEWHLAISGTDGVKEVIAAEFPAP